MQSPASRPHQKKYQKVFVLHDAERRYAPIKGKATATAWGLEKCRISIMGCPNVIVVTDHQTLTGMFDDRYFNRVHNPRLKEKCLRHSFIIQHCPGRWHKGADAISRNPVATKNMAKNTRPPFRK